VDTGYYVASEPVKELDKLISASTVLDGTKYLKGGMDIPGKNKAVAVQYRIKLSSADLKSFSITFSNDNKEHLIAGLTRRKTPGLLTVQMPANRALIKILQSDIRYHVSLKARDQILH